MLHPHDTLLDLERAYGKLIMRMNRKEHQFPEQRQKMKAETEAVLLRGRRLLRQAKDAFEREMIRELMRHSRERILSKISTFL